MHGRTWCHDAPRVTTIFFICFSSLSSIIALRCSCVSQGPAKQDSTPPNELVRRVVENELKAEQEDHSHWSFRETIQKPNGRTEVDEVVETSSGDLKLPIQIDGHELTASEREKSEKQLGHNPQALRKSLRDKDQDTERSQRMLKMLPDAFNFSYVGRLGDLVQLSFTPNPKFHPSSHEAEVFYAMEGNIWLNEKQNRLAEISGRLMKQVKFGGGFLGHLDKGGTFEVKQSEVTPGYWELTVLKVEMQGKALFFKTISVHQDYSHTELRRVPDDLTIAQALELLRKQAVSNKVSQH
jgi:hypothetical protein